LVTGPAMSQLRGCCCTPGANRENRAAL
jgi:hypothetical protein